MTVIKTRMQHGQKINDDSEFPAGGNRMRQTASFSTAYCCWSMQP